MEERQVTDDPMQVVINRMRELRDKVGMTSQELADAMSRAGVPWEGGVVTKLETGRRKSLNVTEMVALAYVLGVAPVDLLVPGDLADDEPYNIAPNVATTADAAREWIRGQDFLKTPETAAELFEAIRWMPKARQGAVTREWFTPERQCEWNRAALEAERQEQTGGEA